MGACTNLATKSELASVETKVDGKLGQNEKDAIIQTAATLGSGFAVAKLSPDIVNSLNQAMTATQLGSQAQAVANAASGTAEAAKETARVLTTNVNQVREVANSAFNTAGQVKQSLPAVQEAARKALLESSYATGRAKAALNAASSAGSSALKAFNLVSSVFSIITTFASIAAVALLTAQVLRLSNTVQRQQQDLRETRGQVEAARIEAKAARERGNEGIRRANEAIKAAEASSLESARAVAEANYATQRADRATQRASAAIEKANAASSVANNAIVEVNIVKLEAADARSKAEIAITNSNKNAQEIASLKTQNQQLEKQQQQLLFKIGWLDFDLNYLRSTIEANQAKIEEKEDKVIVRRVEQSTIANASGLRNIDGTLVGLESKIKSDVNNTVGDVVKKFDEKIAENNKQIVEDIKKTSFDLKRIKEEIRADILGKPLPDSKLKESIDQNVDAKIDSKVENFKKVNDEQVKKITDKIDSQKFPSIGEIAAGVAALDIVKQIATNSSRTNFSCQAPRLVPPVSRQVTATNVAVGVLQGVTIRQGQVTRRLLDHPKTGLKAISKVLTNSKYGLEKAQSFAETAWKATKADKIMSALTTVVVLHNAMMISGNLATTISEATNLGLQALGITDEESNPINIGASVKAKLNEMLVRVLGKTRAEALTIRIAAANRVYQASANVLNLAREIGDTARNIAEVTAENTGKIGNALLDAGVVFDDAYDKMVDNVNPQSKAQMKLEKFRNGAEVLENAANAITEISSSVLEIKDLRKELGQGKAKLDTARASFKATMETEEATTKTESSAETDVNKADFEVANTEDS